MSDRMIPEGAVVALIDLKIEALRDRMGRGQGVVNEGLLSAQISALETVKSHLRFIK